MRNNLKKKDEKKGSSEHQLKKKNMFTKCG